MLNNQSCTQTTDMFAAANRVKGQTVRARLSQTGSYFGIRPLKLANGRLLWPDVQVTAESIRSEK
jgi:hypothetical protein